MPAFESQFDQLGPVEFAKRVGKFAYWIEAQAHTGQVFDRAGAKAEYQFLQDRLSFWLGYQYKSPEAHSNVLGAAFDLYRGAVNAGLVRVGDADGWPKSMAQAVAFASTMDGSSVGHGDVGRPGATEPLNLGLPEAARRAGLGIRVVENERAGIVWGRGIRNQGIPWETQLRSELPEEMQYLPRTKTWDFVNPDTGRAISAKTLDTTAYSYAANPEKVFYRLKGYVNEAAEYELNAAPRRWRLPVSEIQSREIQLAVPEMTSPAQWDRILRAAEYAEGRGVRFVVTRIR